MSMPSQLRQAVIMDFQDLPEPCRTDIQQLAKLSFETLNDNKVIFIFEEIRAFCPEFTGATSGFGLLHAAHHL